MNYSNIDSRLRTKKVVVRRPRTTPSTAAPSKSPKPRTSGKPKNTNGSSD